VTQAAGVFVGLSTLDVIHRVDGPVGPDQKVVARRQDVCAGGPATNAAVTFAGLGGHATLVTALGGHVLARLVAGDLAAYDVLLLDATPSRVEPPAVSVVRVVDPSGERSVSSTNATGSRAPVPGALADLIAAADVVLVDGHHPALAGAAVRAARQHEVPTLLDAGSWRTGMAQLLPLVDYVVSSGDFRVPDGVPGLDALCERGVRQVAVTHGAEPVEWATAQARGQLAVPPVTARDTLGAGDAFHGAAAHRLASGAADWPEILRFAADVAAIRVQHVGPRDWLSDLRSAGRG
jgi:sugar/nucleoside kinase (ribokinase family)